MNEALTLSEKALKYAQEQYYPKMKSLMEAASRGFIEGYIQSQRDNPFHWRDPKKELPEYISGIGCTVLAAIRFPDKFDLPITRTVTFDGLCWRTWDYDKQADVIIDKDRVAAWMLMPYLG